MTAILVSWSQRRASTRTRSRISSTVHRSLPRFGIPAGYGIWESPPLFGRGGNVFSGGRPVAYRVEWGRASRTGKTRDGTRMRGARTPSRLHREAGDPTGIRTRVTTLKEWCPRPLDHGAVMNTPDCGNWKQGMRPRSSGVVSWRED
jgi:hypothetical protein